jgi:hypothetical protein
VVSKEHFFDFFRKKPMKIIWITQQMCLRLRNLTGIYTEVWETLTELAGQENQNYEEDLAWAKLEHFRESQLYSSLYDMSATGEWMHKHL